MKKNFGGSNREYTERLGQEGLAEKGLKDVFRYLSYRPRSEREIRQYLKKRGFDNITERVMEQLVALHLVDDGAFAQFWIENRLSFNPRSRCLLRKELLQKGISGETIDRVLNDVNDELSAVTLARKKAGLFLDGDREEIFHRLTVYLRRRGFSYETISAVAANLWHYRCIDS